MLSSVSFKCATARQKTLQLVPPGVRSSWRSFKNEGHPQQWANSRDRSSAVPLIAVKYNRPVEPGKLCVQYLLTTICSHIIRSICIHQCFPSPLTPPFFIHVHNNCFIILSFTISMGISFYSCDKKRTEGYTFTNRGIADVKVVLVFTFKYQKCARCCSSV